MYINLCLINAFILFYITTAAPQTAEHLEVTDTVTPDNNGTVKIIANSIIVTNPVSGESYTTRIFRIIAGPIINMAQIPKINSVLRNIGICIVNGAMDIFNYYLPPSVMPLIASAAGFYIPFEPVKMLKDKMPVNTYRKAFKTAMSSFLNVFDQFKMDDEFDPYMTQRFNRRFMNDDNAKKKKDDD